MEDAGQKQWYSSMERAVDRSKQMPRTVNYECKTEQKLCRIDICVISGLGRLDVT